jgi:hypothetical protein
MSSWPEKISSALVESIVAFLDVVSHLRVACVSRSLNAIARRGTSWDVVCCSMKDLSRLVEHSLPIPRRLICPHHKDDEKVYGMAVGIIEKAAFRLEEMQITLTQEVITGLIKIPPSKFQNHRTPRFILFCGDEVADAWSKLFTEWLIRVNPRVKIAGLPESVLTGSEDLFPRLNLVELSIVGNFSNPSTARCLGNIVTLSRLAIGTTIRSADRANAVAAEISRLPRLKALQIGDIRMDEAGFAALARLPLDSFGLYDPSGSTLTDRALEMIAGWKLRRLGLHTLNMGPYRDAKRFWASMTGLTNLRLTGCNNSLRFDMAIPNPELLVALYLSSVDHFLTHGVNWSTDTLAAASRTLSASLRRMTSLQSCVLSGQAVCPETLYLLVDALASLPKLRSVMIGIFHRRQPSAGPEYPALMKSHPRLEETVKRLRDKGVKLWDAHDSDTAKWVCLT